MKKKEIIDLIHMIDQDSATEIAHALKLVDYLAEYHPDLYSVICKKIIKHNSNNNQKKPIQDWIKTSELLPNEGETVLTYNIFENMAVETFHTSKEDNTPYFSLKKEVTHWKRLPNKPNN